MYSKSVSERAEKVYTAAHQAAYQKEYTVSYKQLIAAGENPDDAHIGASENAQQVGEDAANDLIADFYEDVAWYGDGVLERDEWK